MAQVAWVVTLLWAVSHLPRTWATRAIWAVVTMAFVSGLVIAWQYPPFANLNWPREARMITTSAPGTKLVLPINPPGGGVVGAIRVTVK
jgi:hypothetical protein